MKILYILGSFPALSQTFVQEEIIELINNGHDISIVALGKFDEPKIHENVKKYNLIDKTLYLTNHSSFMRSLNYLRIINPIKKKKIEHIHCHFAGGNVKIAYDLNRLLGISFTFTTHARDIFVNPDKDIQKWANSAKRVITVSNFNKEYMHKKLGIPSGKIEIVRYGKYLDELKAITKYKINPFKIISISRLVEKKGYPYLIKACKIIKDKGISFSCEIQGDGPQRDLLKNLIRELNLENEIKLGKTLSYKEVIEFIKTGSVFVLPCIRANDNDMDGIPNVLIESMAIGVPTISTDITGIPELIDNEVNGLIVPQKDPKALVEAILKIKNNKDFAEKIRKKARKKVEEKFNIKKNVGKLIKCFRKNLHLMPDHPMSEDFIQMAESVSNPGDNVYIVNSKGKLYKIKNRFKIQTIPYNSKKFWKIIGSPDSCQRVFAHSLERCSKGYYDVLLKWNSDSKFFWRPWGNNDVNIYDDAVDVYEPITLEYLRKHGCWSYYENAKIPSKLDKVISKINYIITPFTHDYNKIKENHSIKAKLVNFFYPDLAISIQKGFFEVDNRQIKIKYNLNRYNKLVLIGNSRNPSNNHVDIFKKLAQFKRKDFGVVVPLSYSGDEKYGDFVIQKGKEYFRKRFIPIKEFLNKKEYINLLNCIDVAIMYHNQPQALCNIKALLYLGKKIYLKSKNLHLTQLVFKGCLLHNVNDLFKNEDILFENLDSRIKNRDALINFSSLNKIKKNTRKVLNVF